MNIIKDKYNLYGNFQNKTYDLTVSDLEVKTRGDANCLHCSLLPPIRHPCTGESYTRLSVIQNMLKISFYMILTPFTIRTILRFALQ